MPETSFPLNAETAVVSRGADWADTNFIWGKRYGGGEAHVAYSPVDGSPLNSVPLLTSEQEECLFAPAALPAPVSSEIVFEFASVLHKELSAVFSELTEAQRLETGFNRTDCDELQEGALSYLAGFEEYFRALPEAPPVTLRYAVGETSRYIDLVTQPWGTVALVLPQNASVLVAVTGLLNALITGNRIILRPPLQCVRSAAILLCAIEKALAATPDWRESLAPRISLVMARAKPFLQKFCESSLPGFIHYMGSSGHAPSVVCDAFGSGKGVIIDGTGNTWVYVDADASVDEAVTTLTEGALRYNGQTCTSINGAIIHPAVYDAVRQGLVARWKSLNSADNAEPGEIGPLFDEKQAIWCESQVRESGGTILVSGERLENLLPPILLEHPDAQSSLVREGVFGPVLWLTSASFETFAQWWPGNNYPLCAAYLSSSANAPEVLPHFPRCARLLINGDPSIEHIYEPWGGYPASGLNPVSVWHHKYFRTVSLDRIA